jgi:hypothetical protein
MIIVCLWFSQPAGGGTVSLALNLAGTVALGVMTYLLATWACWRIAGRPEGPESEAVDIGRTVVRRFAGIEIRTRARK